MASYADSIELQHVSQKREDGRTGTDDVLQSSSSTEVAYPEFRADSAAAPARTVYDSTPLGDSPTTIRLLDVYEQHDGCEPLIRCKLRVVDLADSPHFTALSYVWGDATIQETIWCGDTPVRVTRNAWQALRHLRNKSAPLSIWIDAVCINQMDEDEKMRQISLMRSIYSSAIYVFIWLGEGNQRTERAMRYLETGGIPFRRFMNKKLADLSLDINSDDSWATTIPTGKRMMQRLMLHKILTMGLFHRQIHLYSELQELFSNPWIERIWTMQEIILARHPILVCGDHTISWFAFLCAAVVLDFLRFQNHVVLPPNCERWLQLGAFWRASRNEESESARQSDLERRLAMSAESDHRAYETEDTESLTEREQLNAPASPSETSCNVLLNVHIGEVESLRALWSRWIRVMTYICLGASLTFLMGPILVICMDGSHRNGPGFWLIFIPICMVLFSVFSSWLFTVPSHTSRSVRWKLAVMSQIASRFCSRWEDKYYGVHGIIRPRTAIAIDSASGSSFCQGDKYWTLCKGPSTFPEDLFRTFCLDLISWSNSLDFLLFKPAAPWQGAPSWVVNWDRADTKWIEYLQTFPVSHHAEGPYDTSELQVQVQDTASGSIACLPSGPHSESQLIVHAIMIANVEWLIRPDLDMDSGARRRNLWRQTVYLSGRLSAPWLQRHVARAAEDDRAIISCHLPTEPHNLYGLAPRWAKIGDKIAVVRGLSLPVVLRRERGRQYQVVGPAFVEHLMNGEHWTRKARRSWQRIVLV